MYLFAHEGHEHVEKTGISSDTIVIVATVALIVVLALLMRRYSKSK